MQQHPGASLWFLFSWRDGQNHQMMWPPAMQQHPGASLRKFYIYSDVPHTRPAAARLFSCQVKKRKSTVQTMMHPQWHAVFVIRLKGPRFSLQPHLRLSVFNPWITCTIEPHQKPLKEKEPHLKNEPAWTEKQKMRPVTAASFSTQRQRRVKPWKKANCSTLRRRITQLKSVNSEGKNEATRRPDVQPTTTTGWERHGEKEKKASSSLYLDELLIQKCKFRHRFTVNF